LLVALAGAARPAAAQEPSPSTWPEDYSHLVGSYELSSHATPVTLAVEDALVLTVRLTATREGSSPPEREGLRLFPAGLDKDFFVSRVPPAKDRHLEAEKAWEFSYELKPRHLGVKKIPSLKLVYYDPQYRTYQTSRAPAILLTVKPRPQAQPPAAAVTALPAAENLYELATGPQVLRRTDSGWPGLPALLALVLAPPALCGLWYVWWRRRYPDSGRLARRRRSRAAEQALRGLHALERADGRRVADLFAGYLRERLELSAAEPTPREAARHVRRHGASAALARRTAELLRACDALRFAPAPPEEQEDVAAGAERLILALEAEPCS
jgi:hypothetical protein